MSVSMPWFRLYSETVSDPKIQTLDLCGKWMWITCLCVASASEERGALRFGDVTVTFQALSQIAGVTSQDGEEAVKNLLARGMLNHGDDGVLRVTNWDKRQYPSDSSAERTRKYREKKKENVTSQERHGDVTVTPQILDTDTRLQIEDKTTTLVGHSPEDRVPYERLRSLWNEIVAPKGTPQVESLSASRKQHIRARWKSRPEKLKEIEDWEKFFAWIATECSNVCTKGWFSFDFLFKSETNLLKTLEGNYCNLRLKG
jgi:hypothetical protein